METYNYNYRSNAYVDQTNSYPLMDAESIHRRATAERLGDVGYDCPQSSAYQHHEHHDSCYNYRGPSRYSPPAENYQSPPYSGYDRDYGISDLRLGEENADHSSPVRPVYLQVPSSPVRPLPLSPWMQYSEDEYSRNFGDTQYTPYGELQAGSGMSNGHYFQSPRTVEDNITNLGYRPHYSSDLDGIPTTAICSTSGKINNKQENHTTTITEEKAAPALEPPIDQKNKSVDVRSTGLPTPGRRYRCPVRGCNLQFKRRAEMDRHKESVHQPSPGHLCPIQGCNRGVPDNGFSRKDNLRQHLKLKHEVKFPKGRRSRRT